MARTRTVGLLELGRAFGYRSAETFRHLAAAGMIESNRNGPFDSWQVPRESMEYLVSKYTRDDITRFAKELRDTGSAPWIDRPRWQGNPMALDTERAPLTFPYGPDAGPAPEPDPKQDSEPEPELTPEQEAEIAPLMSLIKVLAKIDARLENIETMVQTLL